MKSKIIKILVLLLVLVQVIDVIGMFRYLSVAYAEETVAQTVKDKVNKSNEERERTIASTEITEETRETAIVEEPISDVSKTEIRGNDEASQYLAESKNIDAEISTSVTTKDRLENQNYELKTDFYPEMSNADGTPKLDYLSGEEIIFYSKLEISSGHFPSNRVKFRIVLPKQYFEPFGEVSDAVTFPISSELSEDSENHYLDITLDNVQTGMNLAIPFRVKFLKPLYYGAKIPITQILYTDKEEEVRKDSLELEAITFSRNIEFSKTPNPYVVPNEYVDSNKLIHSDFVDEIHFDIKESQFLGGNLGDSLVEIQLSENVIFKSEDNDSEWTYNAEKNSISRKFPDGSYIENSFKVRYKNVYADTSNYPVLFNASVNVLNDKGEIESRLSMKSAAKAKKFTFRPIELTAYKGMLWEESSPFAEYYVEENKDKEFSGFIVPVHNGEKGSIFLKKIEDQPETVAGKSPFIITSFWLGKVGNVTGFNKNKLFGVTASGDKILIKENLGTRLFKLKTPMAFRSFYIEFDTPVEFKDSSERLDLTFTAKRSPEYWEYLKENLNDKHQAYNKGIVYSVTKEGEEKSSEHSNNITTLKPKNTLSLGYEQSKSSVFIGEQFDITFNNSVDNASAPKLVNPKLYMILPRGLEFASLSNTEDDVTYTKEENFKKSGKTAIVIEPKKEWTLTDFQKIFERRLRLSVKFNHSADYMEQKIESYLTYENNGTDSIKMKQMWYESSYKLTTSDPYQLLNEETQNKELLTYSSTIKLVPPSILFIGTAASINEEQGFINGKTEPVDQGAPLKQKISVVNYSNKDIDKLVGINVLPHKGDFSTAPDAGGNYHPRGSDLAYLLEGPLEGPEGYTVYYSYDKPSKLMSENVTKNWRIADDEIDYNKVTMIQVKLDKERVLQKNQSAEFTFPVKVPIDASIKNGDKMVNTFTVTTNDKNWVESPTSEIPVTAYQIAGSVYQDRNQNSQKDPNEVFLPGYEVELEKAGIEAKTKAEEAMFTTITDSNGKYKFTTVPSRGNYTVRIKTKEGDIISEYLQSSEEIAATDVILDPANNKDGIATITLAPEAISHTINMGIYSDLPILGTIELTKIDSVTKQGLAGAKFQLEQADGVVIEAEVSTDAQGKILLKNLPLGNYKFVETAAPLGYELDTTPVSFELIDITTAKVTKENTPIITPPVILSSVELTKVDSVTKQALSGAIFQLEQANGTVVQSNLTTNTEGKLVVEDLPLGSYQFVETTAPTGYELDTMPVSFELTNTTRITVTKENTAVADPPVIQGSIELTKVDSDTKQALSGAVFQLRQANGTLVQKELTTDATGKLVVGSLPLGSYQFVETTAPTGYELDATPVSFELIDTTRVKVTKENTPIVVPPVILGSVELTKVDGVTKQALSGAIFQLEQADGTVVQSNLTTNTEGKLVVEDLPFGSYQFVETTAPAGYELDVTPVSFELTDTTRVKVTKENTPIITPPVILSSVELTKVDSVTKQALSGAIFQLEQADGTVVQSNLTTNTEGKLVVEDLPLGSYQFVETTAPAGYELDVTPVSFELTDTTRVKVTKENTPIITPPVILSSVELTKVDSVTKQALSGAIFQLEQADGTVVQSNLTTNTEGKLVVEDLPLGSYQFVETTAPTGYELDTMPVSFELTNTTRIIVTKENTAVTNPSIIQGSVELTKIDRSTKQTLQDAKFRLETADGTVLKKEVMTNKTGKIIVANLPIGKYQFIETAAPVDYELDAKPVLFEITGVSKTVQVTKENVRKVETIVPPTMQKIGIGAENKKRKLPATGEQELAHFINLGYVMILLLVLLIFSKQVYRGEHNDKLND